MSDGPGSFALRGVENLTRTQLGFEREDRIAEQQQFQNQLELRQQQNRNIDANIRRDSLLLRQQEAQRIIDARIKREDVMNRILDSAKTPEERLNLEARFNNFATAEQINDQRVAATVIRLKNRQSILESSEQSRLARARLESIPFLEEHKGKRTDIKSAKIREGLAKQGIDISKREADIFVFDELFLENKVIKGLADQKLFREKLQLDKQFRSLADLTEELVLTGTAERTENSLRFRGNSDNPANSDIIDRINNFIVNDLGATNILQDPIIDIEIRGGNINKGGGVFVLRQSDIEKEGVFRRPQPLKQVVGPRIASTQQFQLWSKNLANQILGKSDIVINQPRTAFSNNVLAIHFCEYSVTNRRYFS